MNTSTTSGLQESAFMRRVAAQLASPAQPRFFYVRGNGEILKANDEETLRDQFDALYTSRYSDERYNAAFADIERIGICAYLNIQRWIRIDL